MIRQAVLSWLRRRVVSRRAPDFLIGPPDDPYLRRWWVLPRNRWFNIYLHQILHDDDDRALHDHPWWNVSWLLQGSYVEWVPSSADMAAGATPAHARHLPYVRREGAVVVRRATDIHRLALMRDGYHLPEEGYGIPCWSLFITGRMVRTWGFWCPQGFRPWKEFVSARNRGEVGAGCGETMEVR